MTELWAERTGVRRYTGRNGRGAEVLVGSEDVDGVFTPGELLKVALAACSGLSSDAPLRARLGDDFPATIRVSGAADREQERYPHLTERLEVDLGALGEEDKARLLTIVARSIDRVCTVGRTLKSGTTVTFDVADEPLARREDGADEPLARREDGVPTSRLREEKTSAPRPPVTTLAELDVRLSAWVHGRVQGVGFRWWTRSRALELGLTGFAANTSDGRVHVVAQGRRDACERLLEQLRGDATPGEVDTVVADWTDPGAPLSGFSER